MTRVFFKSSSGSNKLKVKLVAGVIMSLAGSFGFAKSGAGSALSTDQRPHIESLDTALDCYRDLLYKKAELVYFPSLKKSIPKINEISFDSLLTMLEGIAASDSPKEKAHIVQLGIMSCQSLRSNPVNSSSIYALPVYETISAIEKIATAKLGSQMKALATSLVSKSFKCSMGILKGGVGIGAGGIGGAALSLCSGQGGKTFIAINFEAELAIILGQFTTAGVSNYEIENGWGFRFNRKKESTVAAGWIGVGQVDVNQEGLKKESGGIGLGVGFGVGLKNIGTRLSLNVIPTGPDEKVLRNAYYEK